VSELLEHARRTVAEAGIRPLAAKGARYGRDVALSFVASTRLKAEARHATTIDDAVDLVFRFDAAGVSIKPFQWPSEITALLELLAERRPRTVLEIGTCTGGTLFLLTRVAPDDAVLVSVDLLHGSFGGGYSPAREPLYRSFGRRRQRVGLVRGDSHELRTVELVRDALGGRAVDFLFIDGDHRYEGVSQDFELYTPLVSPDGLIGFHDIVPGDPEKVGGVPRFWGELKAGRPVEEIVRDPEQGSAGIGLVERSALT
jgi:predicted O-methyltransferase YrrM